MGRLKPCYGLGEGEGDIDACTLVFLLSIGRYEIRLEGGPNKETLVVVVGMTSVLVMEKFGSVRFRDHFA